MASLYILPALTAVRCLRLILKLLPQCLRGELAGEIMPWVLQSTVNCSAMSVALCVSILHAFVFLMTAQAMKVPYCTHYQTFILFLFNHGLQ